MNETISYFNTKRSNVYIVLLDATKAFDTVNYCVDVRDELKECQGFSREEVEGFIEMLCIA